MRILAAKAVIFSLLTTSLTAAVPGTPEPPHPGAPPILWAEVGNDDLTFEGAEGTSLDDHRSNEITLGIVIHDVALVIDHSLMTDRLDLTRNDELTVTLGWLPFGDERKDQPWMAVGAGMRFSGNIDGDRLQSRWHHLVNLDTYQLTYDNDDAQAVGYVTASCPWWPYREYGGEALVSALATTYGEVQADLAARALMRSQSGQNLLWAGLRYRGRSGRAPGETARSVASYERGLWADLGWTMGFFSLHVLHDFSDGQSYGMIAMEWRR
jgi:hypothetical protein